MPVFCVPEKKQRYNGTNKLGVPASGNQGIQA
jgi:hypothetical protein